MEGNTIEVDIKVPNKTRYLSLIGKIGEDIARELEKFSGDKDTLAYHLNLVLTEAMVNAIKHAGPKEPEAVVERVLAEVNAYASPSSLQDDISMVVMKVLPSGTNCGAC